MVRVFSCREKLANQMGSEAGRVCTLVITHALHLGWITNLHEILGAAQNEFTDLTKDDQLEFINLLS